MAIKINKRSIERERAKSHTSPPRRQGFLPLSGASPEAQFPSSSGLPASTQEKLMQLGRAHLSAKEGLRRLVEGTLFLLRTACSSLSQLLSKRTGSSVDERVHVVLVD
ncbi:hypothetical protein CRENBAI_000405 [Crenichthys baileyi]|uniref:Uncharacterized protein n=1 Tax=Crenichthys baileyi TaxID=28760 RepID=A0AAV9SCN9_9TELE